MRTKFARAALGLAVAAILTTPGAGDTANATPQRNDAIGVVRLLAAAEADYFRHNARYATLADLVESGQLGKTATDAPENLRAFFALNVKSEADPAPGFILGLDVSAEGNTYKLSLEPKGEKCVFRLLANEKGVSEESPEECRAEAEANDAAETWAPPDIDQSVPVLHGDAPCPLATVLQEASRRVQALGDNLQKFSAKERIEHREVGKNGKLRGPTTGTFSYVAEVDQSQTGTTYIDEYRSALSGAQESSTPIVDTGTAAFALVFHPRHIDEFAMTCEGMADAGGRPAWLVRFSQRGDRNNEFHAYRVNSQTYRASVKGRAWIGADNYEVVRMETDLMEPIPAIGLEKEHLVIEYAPVDFRRRNLQLWLPESATLYINFHGHRYARSHTFSDFQLFSVDTVEKVKEPVVANENPRPEAPSPSPTMGLMPDNSAPRPPVPAGEMPLTPK